MNGTLHTDRLPLKGSLTLYKVLSLIIAALMVAACLVGMFLQDMAYPTQELLDSFLPTDVAVLFIGVPMMLASLWLVHRGRLVGLLLWPGALVFVLYNYLTYVLAMPLNIAFLLHLALFLLSVYTLPGLLTAIDHQAVLDILADAVPARLSGGIVAVMGLLFFLRAFIGLIASVAGSTSMPGTEIALNATDALISPAWVVCGVMLWRRKPFGTVCGLGILFQASMLFIGLIILLFLQPTLTGAPLAVTDIVVVFVMGLISFIPFGLYIRGVVQRERQA